MKKDGKPTVNDLLGDAPRGVFDAESAFEQLLQDFPDMRDVTTFFDSADEETEDAIKAMVEKMHAKGITPQDRGTTIENFIDGANENLRREVQMNEEGVCITWESENLYFPIVVINSKGWPRKTVSRFTGGRTLAQNDRFPCLPEEFDDSSLWQELGLDHEFAHAISHVRHIADNKPGNKASAGTYKRSLQEMNSDVFAIIRHFQEYGKDSEFPQYVADMRLIGCVHLNTGGYLTTLAMEEIITKGKSGELQNLSAQESFDLARDTALKYAHRQTTVRLINKNFEETTRINQQQIHENVLPAVITAVGRIGGNTMCPTVQKVAEKYLSIIEKYAHPTELRGADLASARERVADNSFDHVPSLRNLWNRLRWATRDTAPAQAASFVVHGFKPPDLR